jgi:hypothetical protein
MMGKNDEHLTRREQLLSFWLLRRAVPTARAQKYTLAWAASAVHCFARRRHEKACRLADAEDDKLLRLALAGDADASIQLGMSSYSDPRRRRWQDWNGPTYWGNAIRAAFLLVSMGMVIYGTCWQVYAIFKWGVEGPPESPSSYPLAPRR